MKNGNLNVQNAKGFSAQFRLFINILIAQLGTVVIR